MTLHTLSRRVSKRHRGIAQPRSLSARTKSEIFALMLLPRAFTLGLNLGTTEPMVDVAQAPIVVQTRVVFDTKNAIVPISIVKNDLYVEKVSSRAEESAKAAAARQRVVQLSNVSTTSVANPPEPDHVAKRVLVQQIAADSGIDWKLLESVWQIESGKAWKTGVVSSAGAQGPMQFMPGTWRGYGGNGDITSAPDALKAGAKLLAANGAASGDEYRALFAYNHAEWYVQQVQSIMKSI